MSTVYKYRFMCPNEGTYSYIWGTEAPSKCPHDGSEIDPETIIVIETVSSQQVTAVEASEGYYQATAICIDIPNGKPKTVYMSDLSWPANILLWTATLYPEKNSSGDIIDVITSPDTGIGRIVEDTTSGVNTFKVSTSVINNIVRGLDIIIKNGDKTNELGGVVAIDKENKIITTQFSTTDDFPINSLLFLNIYTVKNYKISEGMTSKDITFGHKGFKGKIVTAGQTLRIKYLNNSGSAKTVGWKLEYYIVD